MKLGACVCCGSTSQVTPAADFPVSPPVSSSEFATFLDVETGGIADWDRLQRRIESGSTDPDVRERIWRHLLGLAPYGASNKEMTQIAEGQRAEYQQWRTRWEASPNLDECTIAAVQKYRRVIEGDVARTDRSQGRYQDPAALDPLKVLLLTYCAHPLGEEVGYFQGMNDVAAVLCTIVEDESSQFWFFVNFVRWRLPVYRDFPTGLWSVLEGVHVVLQRVDPVLNTTLLEANSGSTQQACLFQAAFLLLKREMIDYEAVCRVWESCFLQGAVLPEVFLLAGLLRLRRQAILGVKDLDLAALVQLFNQMTGTIESNHLLRMAQVTKAAFIQDPAALGELRRTVPVQHTGNESPA